jgi:hypothetical protein
VKLIIVVKEIKVVKKFRHVIGPGAKG